MNALSNFISDVLAVLVIYETIPEQSSTYRCIENCIRKHNEKLRLLIYDNSLSLQKTPTSEHLIIRHEHDPTNGGVSKAYNFGYRYAKSLGARWLWLLDQDDEFSNQAISAYQIAAQENPEESILVPIVLDQNKICSPFRIRFGGGWRISEIKPGVYPLHWFLFINSGLMISLSAFEGAQGYDESFPLDFSDLDLVHRLRRDHHSFVVVDGIHKHSLSINIGQTAEKQLTRFRSYVKAANLFRKKYPTAIPSIALRSLFIAFKLGLRHRTLVFLKEYFLIWQ